jgi:hypothetical protein
VSPWDVPETREGRAELERLVTEYERGGKLRELGITLTKLAQLVKQLGPSRQGEDWGAVYHSCASRAVEVLRQTDDMPALAAALRALASPFAAGNVFQSPNSKFQTPLDEALQLCREAGDANGEGWTLFAMSASDSKLVPEALACFERAGNSYGIANWRLRAGVRAYDAPKIIEAAELFASLGEDRQAEEAFVMATVFGRDKLTVDETEALLLRALEHAKNRGAVDRQKLILDSLSKAMRKAKRSEAARTYEVQAQSLGGL